MKHYALVHAPWPSGGVSGRTAAGLLFHEGPGGDHLLPAPPGRLDVLAHETSPCRSGIPPCFSGFTQRTKAPSPHDDTRAPLALVQNQAGAFSLQIANRLLGTVFCTRLRIAAGNRTGRRATCEAVETAETEKNARDGKDCASHDFDSFGKKELVITWSLCVDRSSVRDDPGKRAFINRQKAIF